MNSRFAIKSFLILSTFFVIFEVFLPNKTYALPGSLGQFCTNIGNFPEGNNRDGPYCRGNGNRADNGDWFTQAGQGTQPEGRMLLNPINFSKDNGYLVIYMSHYYYNVYVSVNGIEKTIKFDMNQQTSGMKYTEYGGGGIRVETGIPIHKNDQMNILLQHPDYPGVECGEAFNVTYGFCREPGDSGIWRVINGDEIGLEAMFNAHKDDIGAQPIVEIITPDTNLRKNDAGDGYQYFYDMDVPIFLGIYGSLGPPCEAGDVTMSVNPSTQYENLTSVFQVSINQSNVSLSANPIINGATLDGQIQHVGNTYTGNYIMTGAPGNYNWTVNYNKGSAAEGGVSSCSKTGSFVIQETPPPPCDYGTPYPISVNPEQVNSGDLSMSVVPFPQVRYKKASFQVVIPDKYSLTNPNRDADMIMDAPTFPGQVSSCVVTLNEPSRKTYTCEMIGPEGTYPWTVNYRLYAKGKSPSGNRNNCSKTSVFGIQDPPGYLITHGGDVYLKNGINMPSFETWAYTTKCSGTSRNRCLADYLWAADTNQNTACKNCSTKNYSRHNSYQDQNLVYLNYDKILAMVLDRASKTTDMTVVKNVSNDSFSSIKRRVVVLNNDLTIAKGTVCDTPSIYFVPGNLTVDPDFTIKNSTNASSKVLGCVFVVKGNLNILAGTTKGTNNYDLIHGFFILTENTSTVNAAVDNYESLRIVGGLVLRDVNVDNLKRKPMGLGEPITELQPSEIIEYEGARYIDLFGDVLLDNQAVYTIREAPFIQTYK
jgi:hypothetical protein